MGAVPTLRFPEFDEAWSENRLGNLTKPIGSGKSFKSKTGQFPVYGSTGIIGWSDVADHIEPALLIARVGANAGKMNKVHGKFGVTDNTLIVRTKDGLDHNFCYYYLDQANLNKYIFGSGQPLITGTILRRLKGWLPKKKEQIKIAAFLTAVDKKLTALEAQFAEYNKYKRGMVQALFSQNLRFKRNAGSNFPAWQTVKLSEVLYEHKLKSHGTEPVYSVSVHKGLVDQITHLGRSYSAKDTSHYNKVELGDVIYTKSPTGNFPLGIIKQSHIEHDVIVSPLYGVFRPETVHLGKILHTYFEAPEPVWNYLNPIVQKGAKNTISCTNTNFLSNKLTLPRDEDEQRKIADAISSIDKKINALSDSLDATREFKRGLLQKMFI